MTKIIVFNNVCKRINSDSKSSNLGSFFQDLYFIQTNVLIDNYFLKNYPLSF